MQPNNYFKGIPSDGWAGPEHCFAFHDADLAEAAGAYARATLAAGPGGFVAVFRPFFGQPRSAQLIGWEHANGPYQRPVLSLVTDSLD